MLRIWTIAANTFTEVIRQPVYLVVLGCSLALVLLSPYFTWFTLMENLKLIKDMGLANLLLTGLLIASFSASTALHQEIENKTVLTVISKPVPRHIFILGKYLGVLGAILVAEYLLSIVLIQVVRTEITEAVYSKNDYPVLVGYLVAVNLSILLAAYLNFFSEKPFASATVTSALYLFTITFCTLSLLDNNWQLQSFAQNLDSNIILACLLIFFAVTILAAIAIAASTRLAPSGTLGVCAFLFLLGLLSDYLFGRSADDYLWAKLLYTVVPNLQFYLVTDAIIEKRDIPWDYLLKVGAYTICYLSSILSIAIVLFEEREIK